MTPEDKIALFSELQTFLEARDVSVELDGPALVTVKLKDGTFRRKTLGRSPFFLSEIYPGQKDLIFCFVPEDILPEIADCTQIEVPGRDLDAAFPFFLDKMSEWMVERFALHAASRIDEIGAAKGVPELITLAQSYHSADTRVAELSAEEELARNPLFGMF